MKREKRLTKKEKKASGLIGTQVQEEATKKDDHIHCVACGKHLEPTQFDPPATAMVLKCQHGSTFPACVGCAEVGRSLLAEHDRTGEPVKTASVWH